MKQHLLILGDVRIGDCFHVGTYLNKFKYSYQTTWIHGTYERNAVRFLKEHTDLNIIRTIEKQSECLPNIPTDLYSIQRFIDKHNSNNTVYDTVTNNTSPIFFNKNDEIVYQTKNLPDLPKDKYIVVHASTVSNWKEQKILFEIEFGCKVYGVGHPKEKIVRNAIDYRGKPLKEVAALMKKAICVVGLHSSMSCLAFHLNVPLITCHFWEGKDLIKFSDYRDNCTDLLIPNEYNIKKAIDEYTCKS